MSKYAEMSDTEINKLVANKQHDYSIYNKPDYCNNPEDAWPIIVESDISTRYDKTLKKSWAELNLGCGYTQSIPFKVEHKNRLRAAMEVYLMMGDEA